MKKLLNRFAKWLMVKTCDHKKRKTLWIDYPDAYVKEQCNKCKTILYSAYD